MDLEGWTQVAERLARLERMADRGAVALVKMDGQRGGKDKFTVALSGELMGGAAPARWDGDRLDELLDQAIAYYWAPMVAIEQRALEVAREMRTLRKTLPAHELTEVEELVHAGEPGVALELLCTQIGEHDVPLPPDLLERITGLCEAMKLDAMYARLAMRRPR